MIAARWGSKRRRAVSRTCFSPSPASRTRTRSAAHWEGTDPRARKPIPRSDITHIVTIKSTAEAIEEAVTLFAAQAQAIAEAPGPPDVIICALPFELISRVLPDSGLARHADGEDDQTQDHAVAPDFRDLLKARTIHLKRPLQIVWPTTWEDGGRIVRQLSKMANRPVQDPATRAWNLFGGLYYKAGYVPWRLPRDPSQFDTSYVGISFYRDISGQRLLTSTAQMFDERGQGLILRGGQARTDKQDRRPYLSRTDAYDLLKRSLTAYGAHHFHAPARVIVYKTSPFRPEEVDGFQEALQEAHVRLSDFVWVAENSEFRLYRDGAYPPLRGTCLELEQGALLYCRGSVPYCRTYPGLYIPKPLLLRPYQGGESTLAELSRGDSRALQDELELDAVRWLIAHHPACVPGRWSCAAARVGRCDGGGGISPLHLTAKTDHRRRRRHDREVLPDPPRWRLPQSGADAQSQVPRAGSAVSDFHRANG